MSLKSRNIFYSQRGDTIMEVMISVAVLGLMIAAAFTITNKNQISVRESQERSEAVKVAETQIELLRAYYSSRVDGQSSPPASFCFKTNDINPIKNTNQTSSPLEYADDCKQISGYTYNVNIWSPKPAASDGLSNYSDKVDAKQNSYAVTVRWDGLDGTPNEVKMFYAIGDIDYQTLAGSAPVVTDTPVSSVASEVSAVACNQPGDGCNVIGSSSPIWIMSNSYTSVEAKDDDNPNLGTTPLVSPRTFQFSLDNIESAVNGANINIPHDIVLNYQNKDGFIDPSQGSIVRSKSTYSPHYQYYKVKYCVASTLTACSEWKEVKLPLNQYNYNTPLSSVPLRITATGANQNLYIAWSNNHYSTYSKDNSLFDPNLQINSITAYRSKTPAATGSNNITGSGYIACSYETAYPSANGCYRDDSTKSMYAWREVKDLTYNVPSPLSQGVANIEIKYRNRENVTNFVYPGVGYALRLKSRGSTSYTTGLLLPNPTDVGASQKTFTGTFYVPSCTSCQTGLIDEFYLAWDNNLNPSYAGHSTDYNLQIDSIRIWQ